MRDTVNEESAFTIRARFFDPDDVAVTPQTARYRLKDVTNCRVVIDWTELTPAAFIDIEIDAQDNQIYSRCNASEERVLSVQANYGQSNQFADEKRYVIQNLKGFST